LGHFDDKVDVALLDPDGVIGGGEFLRKELHIDHGADYP
jgi:hypothetical protein